MKLLVPPCFHKMCEACIDRLFSLGPAPCPVCQQILRKTNFWIQTFEDLTVEKELRVRKRIAKCFNKRPQEFRSQRAYNDYLEEVEDITFNLINGIDIQETEERIQKFALENRDSIAANMARAQHEERALNRRMEQEKAHRETQRQQYRRQLDEEEAAKTADKDSLINQLATSGRSASDIMAQRAITLKRSSMRKPADQLAGGSGGYRGSAGHSRHDHDWAYDHDDGGMDVDEADYSPLDNLYANVGGFVLRSDYYDPMANSQQGNAAVLTAGGYLPRFAHQRALESAFAGLLVAPLSGLTPDPEA
ncbi:TFIIH/NER complex subunit [Tieghemiomyces parasiticus]|uniref:RNA polymerase II transcription factor B subunit 3 n=1 Tax=Tieghemiomyces parasiticus TaxID=78921 RepID=A0A9W7ZM72_9FUNG|nr:TFIIH/NER complex subunit [Tieghemiomyces parasiticus]